MGSRQQDGFQSHTHQSTTNSGKGYTPGGTINDYLNPALAVATTPATGIGPPTTDGAYGTPRISKETRPVNTAYVARIHA
mgnify:CR=1 FL=1